MATMMGSAGGPPPPPGGRGGGPPKTPADKPFPFLLLPKELRLMILEYLLAPAKEGMSICNRVQPQVLRTNKQIYHEARDTLYGHWAPRLRFTAPPSGAGPNDDHVPAGCENPSAPLFQRMRGLLREQLTRVTTRTLALPPTFPMRVVVCTTAMNSMLGFRGNRHMTRDRNEHNVAMRIFNSNEIRTAFRRVFPQIQVLIVHFDFDVDEPNFSIQDLLQFVADLYVPRIVIEVHAPGHVNGREVAQSWVVTLRNVIRYGRHRIYNRVEVRVYQSGVLGIFGSIHLGLMTASEEFNRSWELPLIYDTLEWSSVYGLLRN